MLRGAVVLSIFLTLVYQATLGSTTNCEKFYSVSKLNLPNPAVELIQKHRLYQLRKLHGQGEDVIFVSQEIPLKGSKSNPNGVFGENLQMRFVRETLQHVLPKALFLNPEDVQGTPNSNKKKIVNMRISDSAEDLADGMIRSRDEFKDLDMSILKQANPGQKLPSRSQLRKAYRFNDNQKIVSVYVSPWNFHHLDGILEKIREQNQDSIVIISLGGMVLSKKQLGEYMKDPKFEETAENIEFLLNANLSEIINGKYDITEFSKWPDLKVVFNDTFGKMSEIASLSDLAVIAGPINFIEPLAQGTPTVFMTDPSIVGDYGYFKSMKDVAVSTGRGFPVESQDSLKKNFGLALASRIQGFVPPYLIKSASGKTIFEDYLDHLTSYLEKQSLF